MNDTTQVVLAEALELACCCAGHHRALVAVHPLVGRCGAGRRDASALVLRHHDGPVPDAPEEAPWVFNGMWVSSLVAFVACAALGAALGFSPLPIGKSARFILGLVPPAVLAVVWALGVRWMA